MSAPAGYLRFLIISITLLMALVALFNWRVDPLHQYRPDSTGFLVGPARYRLAGLARHSDAHLVIAGTSVSVHQRPEPFQKRYVEPKDSPFHVLNLAMDGATAREQYLLLRLALRTGSVREVIWDINYEYLRGEPDAVSDYDGAFPGYLYDDSFLNDVPNYLLSITTAKDSVKIVTKRYTRQVPEEFSLLRPGIAYGAEAVAKAMERRTRGAAQFRKLLPQFAIEKLRASFDHNHLALIREFPTVTFRLYFPPFSSAYFDFLSAYAPELLPIFLQFRDSVSKMTRDVKNAELHDLQSDVTLITDLSHFADPIHFDATTHVLVAKAIIGQSHLANRERLASFETWLKKRSPSQFER